MNPPDLHYRLVANRLLEGRVIPFLGAGANLCGRPQDSSWAVGTYLPSGIELATYLAGQVGYPGEDDGDLLRVSQYIDAVLGEQPLYDYLRVAFDADYPPNPLHHLLVDVAHALRRRGRPGLLVLTTNYDDVLERAFDKAREPYHVLSYDAKGGSNQLVHRAGGEAEPIVKPNETLMSDRAVILKLHGAVDRTDPRGDSYVVTEDHYIAYAEQIPVDLQVRMEESHFLFLGYSLRDWNLRVILSRIWRGRQLESQSWAVQRPQGGLSEIDTQLWRKRGNVDLRYVELDEYVAKLSSELDGPTAVAA